MLANAGLTRVLPGVRDERGGNGEGHAAQVALVRFLSGVSALVVRQRAGLSERLTADVAHVRLLSAVQPAGNKNAVTTACSSRSALQTTFPDPLRE